MAVTDSSRLKPGDFVRCRSRRHLVEEITLPPNPGDDTLVRLSCLEDDSQGEESEVLWERELDSEKIEVADWSKLARGEFDPPSWFAAYYRTLRWNTVTSTDPELFQAPYRAGIRIDAYQLEPLRKALLLPRVNLFIADDVGLGKTIEAGLIVRELLMRQRVRRIVVAAPPSVVLQWKDELDQRFGLTFVVFDREYVRRMRMERGYGVNPWTTHSRFVISHHLLRDEDYASLLRDWLSNEKEDGLLILDEAHNAAPASGAKYAVDSQFTKAVRELAPMFEHRLFLSATPHNGHSNSFSSLLEILDDQRFCRGVPVEGAEQLEPIMVRRLKDDLRKLEGGFPERKIVEVKVDGLSEADPQLLLPKLLDEYRVAREERLKGATKSVQSASALVLCSLQKRLLSSIESFASTLKVHRDAFESHASKATPVQAASVSQLKLEVTPPDADDERADADENDVQIADDTALAAATRQSVGAVSTDVFTQERELLARMSDLANQVRGLPDAKVNYLADWIRQHKNQRVLIFTEYADTKRYVEKQLRALLTPGHAASPMIATYHGGMVEEAREEVKRAFNAELGASPLRVLIATDAAREGVNLQNNCANLFHFDVPWNPSRLEQRNGRIDRKLQRADVVFCHYFNYAQRPEDRVLKALVQKAKTIRKQLGSLAPVLERRLEERLSNGFTRSDAGRLADAIESEQVDAQQARSVDAELEATRKREGDLKKQIADLQLLLKKSSDWLDINKTDLRQAISCGLELLGVQPLENGVTPGEFVLPPAIGSMSQDVSWQSTLDSLRPPLRKSEPIWEWRKHGPRPVVFEDPGSLDAHAVQLHLEHRFVQRILGRFRSQGFVNDDLARACIGVTSDPVPRVILLGRLSLYGHRASRLHDEVLAVAARWTDTDVRTTSLEPYEGATLQTTLALLDTTLGAPQSKPPSQQVRQRLASGAKRDLDELLVHLSTQAKEQTKGAERKLEARAKQESAEMRSILKAQRARIKQTTADREKEIRQLALFAKDELRQLEDDKRHWRHRLDALEIELESEPARIAAGYEVKASRFEPVGLVYLWPVTG